MSAEKFLELVKQTGLVDDALLAKLRKQAGAKGTAESLAQTLVKNGLLTKAQAARLLGQLGPAAAANEGRPTKPPKAAVKSKDPLDDELGLAPLDEDQDLGLAPDKEETKAEDEEVVLLEDASGGAPQDLGLTPLDENETVVAPTKAKRQPPSRPAGVTRLDASAGLQPLEPVGGLQPLDAASGLQPLEATSGLQPLADAGGLQTLDEGDLAGGELQPASGALQQAARPGARGRGAAVGIPR